MSESNLKIPVQKQSEVVAAAKNLLSLARSGKITAIGYAIVTLDDDGGMSAGTDAVWTDETNVRDALEETIQTLYGRVAQKSKSKLLLLQ